VRSHEHVVVVCAGTGGATRFALEDFAAAGVLVQSLQLVAGGVALGDAAALALRVAARPPGATRGRPLPSPAELLAASSEHARRLKELGFNADVAFSARVDTSSAAPIVVECGPGWAKLQNQRSV
jgi:phosphosulfolactate phosphohydrolase-like enzyme